MHAFYADYIWQKGTPRGHQRLLEPTSAPHAYKIVVDPYYKRHTIERYQAGRFESLIYDSLLLDFRHLKTSEQHAWQREIISQTSTEMVCLIRDQIDRVIYFETHRFEGMLCRECRMFSPHRLELSTLRMFYTGLNDPFNGVLLYDRNDHLVLAKRYAINGLGEFTELLEERWDMHQPSFLDRWMSSACGDRLGDQMRPY